MNKSLFDDKLSSLKTPDLTPFSATRDARVGLDANLLIALDQLIYRFYVWFSVEQHLAITVAEKIQEVANRNYKTVKPSMFIELNHFESQMTALEQQWPFSSQPIRQDTSPTNRELREKIAASFSFC